MGIGLLQPMHLLLILVIVLVVFGAGKLSQVGGALGQSVKEFKQAVDSEAEGEAEGGQLAAAAPAKPAGAKQEQAAAASPRAVGLLQREEI